MECLAADFVAGDTCMASVVYYPACRGNHGFEQQPQTSWPLAPMSWNVWSRLLLSECCELRGHRLLVLRLPRCGFPFLKLDTFQLLANVNHCPLEPNFSHLASSWRTKKKFKPKNLASRKGRVAGLLSLAPESAPRAF